MMLNYFLLLQYLLYMDPKIGLEYAFKTQNCFVFTSENMIRSCNRVCHNSTPTDSEVQECKTFFKDIPFSWVMDSKDIESIKIIERNGVQYKDTFPAMLLDLDRICPVNYNEIRVENICLDSKAIECWLTIVSQAFKLPMNELLNFINLFKTKVTPNVLWLYLGYYKEKAVAASMMIRHQDIVSIHWVGTMPEFRKKGLGFAITHKGLLDAKARGIKQAILLSSNLGKPVYERLGFKEYALYKVYGN